jgi:hypothetical protein
VRIAALGSLLLVLPACKGAAPAGPTADAASAPVAGGHASATPAAPPSHLPCRAIDLAGAVALAAGDAGSQVLSVQANLPDGWLVVGAGGKFVAKDPRTARETTFMGPARVRSCVEGAEESWVSEGAFESSAGTGEAPGAEEWVVTPDTIVRYIAARLHVDVRPSGTTATISAGVAFIWPPQRPAATGDADGWQRAEGAQTVLVPRGIDADAAAGLARCTALARRTRTLTEALLSGAADAGAVVEQVTSRRLARAACDVARLRLTDSGAAHLPPDWSAQLAEADRLWHALR